MQTESETINRLLELGAHLTRPLDDPEHDPIAVIPHGCKIENLSAFYPPRFIKQSVQCTDAESFCRYVNQFKTPHTQIFSLIGSEAAQVKAVLDYHEAEPLKAARGSHVARFHLQPTDDWKVWLAADRQRKGQIEFAEWLEENSFLLIAPTGAELLELVQTLHGHSEARFNQTFRLKDGAVKLAFDEDVVIRGTAGVSSKAGELEVPAFIQARLSPFEGMPAQQISARLKVRLENRKLVLWFETVQLAAIVRSCVNVTLDYIAEKTEITPLRGSC